jgi:hypothetical protein
MKEVNKTNANSVKLVVNDPDQSWRSLYTAGGVCAILYVVLAILVPAVMVWLTHYDFELKGSELLEFIAGHRAWWMFLQGLVLESSILLIVTFVALFVAFKHLNKSYTAIGAVVGVTSQILFMAYYPILLGLVYLSDQFKTAEAGHRNGLVAAAEALIAQNAAFNPVYEVLFAAGILIISIVMLRGGRSKGVAYIGIAASVAVIGAMALFPVIGLAYLFWWVVMTVWLVAIGWKLIRVGKS